MRPFCVSMDVVPAGKRKLSPYLLGSSHINVVIFGCGDGDGFRGTGPTGVKKSKILDYHNDTRTSKSRGSASDLRC
jgi:hypothetical protein